MKFLNVKDIYRNDLCIGCGTCAGVCPELAISMVKDSRKGLFRPWLDTGKCRDCGLCREVCPGLSVDFLALNREIFGKQPEVPFLGNQKGMYVVHANDEKIRYCCSSGGAVSVILITALETGLIDGAIVTRMNRSRPLEPEVFLARTPHQILEAAGSKYCPVPANAILSNVLRQPGKFALVGLPCHVHGFRKLEKKQPKVKNSVVLTLGLMCSNTVSFLATEYLIGGRGIEPEDVADFAYRRGGWLPKSLLEVETRKGMKKVVFDQLPLTFKDQVIHTATFHRNFVPVRCLSCCDQTNEMADLAFGDPRDKELTNDDKLGKSLVVVRTNKGMDLLSAIKDQNKIVILKELDAEGFFRCQAVNGKAKAAGRIWALRKIGKSVPSYLPKPPLTSFGDRLEIAKYAFSFISHFRCLWPVLFPFSLIKAFAYYSYRRLMRGIRF